MAVGAVSSARDPQQDVRWKWLLLALCSLGGLVIAFVLADNFGLGGRPWFGWWDTTFGVTDSPFITQVLESTPGGAAANAGLRYGDRVDLREMNFETRVRWLFNPVAATPVTYRVHRGAQVVPMRFVASTVWDGDWVFKVAVTLIQGPLPAAWFLGCATLIAARRWWIYEARLVAIAMLCQIGVLINANYIAVPSAELILLCYATSSTLLFGEATLLIALSGRYGKPVAWRKPLQLSAYALNTVALIVAIVAAVSIVTLWTDPAPLIGQFVGTYATIWSVIAKAALLTVALCAFAAVVTAPPIERPRTASLVLPLPLALFGFEFLFSLTTLAPSAFWFDVVDAMAGLCCLVGGLVVTFALLNRRVLDFGFVLSRTLVVSIVGFIVVIAFVLLEWMLGTVMAGVSHATGLIANAALALVLGVSLNYIHRHVDRSVDLVLFRKRHEDERALVAFSKEAAYVTDWDALLDATLEKIRRHTDARNAAVLIRVNGFFTAFRSFGVTSLRPVSENDEAILALKVWHKPIDPHHYDTVLRAALALPMLARGRLYGVLLLGERAGGEAYAPDEVEALSQLANGVGSALEALSLATDGSTMARADQIEALHRAVVSIGDRIASEIRNLRPSSLT